MRRLALVGIGGLLIGAFAAAPAMAASTVVVTPDNMNGWTFFDDDPGTGFGTGALVKGPGTPPAGTGSALLTVDSQGRYALSTQAFTDTKLSQITKLTYDTFNLTPGPQAISLQFDVDFNLADASDNYQGRLVYEPYLSGGAAVTTGQWQSWDALAGKWYASHTDAAASNGQCTQTSPCTVAQLIQAFPNIGIRHNGGLVLKAGGPWSNGFSGAVDKLVVNDTTIDFEQTAPTSSVTPSPSVSPSAVATSSATVSATPSATPSVNPSTTPNSQAECQNNGWQTFSNPSFSNQTDCYQYVAQHQVQESVWTRLFHQLQQILGGK